MGASWSMIRGLITLMKELNGIIDDSHPGFLKRNKDQLLSAMHHNDFAIVTEMRRLTRSAALETKKQNEKLYVEERLIVTDFARRIISKVD